MVFDFLVQVGHKAVASDFVGQVGAVIWPGLMWANYVARVKSVGVLFLRPFIGRAHEEARVQRGLVHLETQASDDARGVGEVEMAVGTVSLLAHRVLMLSQG